ncbi:maleylpyruvate isomerase family mycothiol-dependent enzyme, partial [Parasphingorhabdus sp.]|uniref:maleylpyruvate isomerase family mycothiol-dependent enzyme n=1 Tax=Parasphingorhabdus sp. TaxID=2709688 RepID=UPI003C721C62
MMQEARDFKDESDTLAAGLAGAGDDLFATVTQFKRWTIEDVIGHLHIWNIAALMTLQDPDGFKQFISDMMGALKSGKSHVDAQYAWLDEHAGGIRGKALFDAYCSYYPKLAAAYGAADPEARVAWAGPDMTTRSKIIARQMETWSHGQEIFDILGKERKDGDRIRNIAHLGVTTYGWTFRNRRQEPPAPKPFVQLTAPSGTVWEWNDLQKDNLVRGSAVEFAQVVTQTRNIDDTALETVGVT